LTVHAAAVIAEREIDASWIARAFSRPDRTEPHPLDRSLMHALIAIPERGDRVLRVVYNPSYKPPKVVTAYFDRRQRGKP